MSSKVKKKGEKVLLLPGADGWEVWTAGSETTGFGLSQRSGTMRVLDVTGIPPGELTMAFPVRDVSALPFRAPTSDDALLSDLAEMHLERMGVRPGINAGVLSDVFKVATVGEECLAVPIVLAPPREGDLPRRAPQHFDISARCLPLPSDGLVIWQELGRWVFALFVEGQALEFEALAINQLGEEAGREIRITLLQLELQGVSDALPAHCTVWLGQEEAEPSGEQLQALGEGIGLSTPVTVASKPAPVPPTRSSQLLPADVRAERAAKRKKQQTVLVSAMVAAAYVFGILFLWADLRGAEKDADQARKAYEPYEADDLMLSSHRDKWASLQPVVEQEHGPLELFYHCMRARGGEAGLRFDRAEISNQVEVEESPDGSIEFTLIRDIRIQGKAEELEQATAFDLALKRERGLRDYLWTSGVPVERNGKWGFFYEARIKGPEDQ